MSSQCYIMVYIWSISIQQPQSGFNGAGPSDTSTDNNIPFTAVSDEAQPLDVPTPSEVSSETEHHPETLKALPDISWLQEKHESLEACVKHLKGDMNTNPLRQQQIE